MTRFEIAKLASGKQYKFSNYIKGPNCVSVIRDRDMFLLEHEYYLDEQCFKNEGCVYAVFMIDLSEEYRKRFTQKNYDFITKKLKGTIIDWLNAIIIYHDMCIIIKISS